MKYLMKTLAQVITSILAGIAPLIINGSNVTPSQWINAGITAIGAFMVFAAPNVPGAMYTKAIISAAVTALTLLASLLTDGLTGLEILQIIIAFVGTITVAVTKNSEPDKPGRHSADNVRVAG